MFHKFVRWIIPLVIISIFIGGFTLPVENSQAASPSGGNCRFGLTVPRSLAGIDMVPLKVGAVLNWSSLPMGGIPSGMEFIHVLNVGECRDKDGKNVPCPPDTISPYERTLQLVSPPDSTVQSVILAYPGDFWIIGNEPDTTYEGQDNLTAEEYANRFNELATRIRQLDPTAKIGFGTIVQPTPIRLRYLDKAWNQLVALQAGSTEAEKMQAASDLVDIWTSHGFILNEVNGEWGTGVPLGFENDNADAVIISNLADTYSISIFSNRIKKYRQWLKDKGEQNKPLWITEYGSLFPPITTDNYVTVSDATTLRYMISTFNFLMTAADLPTSTDTGTGMPLDNYHLVQRWFWYSLNDHRYNFGGSLFNIDRKDTHGNPLPPASTVIGVAYKNYAPKDKIYSEFHFINEPGLSISPADASHFKINIRVANTGTSSSQAARVWVYQDNPSGPPLAILNTPVFHGCADSISFSGSVEYPKSAQGFSKLYLQLDKNGDGIPQSNDEIVVLDAPPAVSGLSTVPRSRTRIRLDWVGSPNSEGYHIERSIDGGTTWEILSSSAANTYIDTGLSCNRSYQYRVRPYKGSTDWAYGNIASAITDGCNPPVISALTMSQRRINLTWVNNLVTVSGFKVQRLNGSNWEDIGTAPGDAVGYSIFPLTCGTSHAYRIQPFNNNDGILDTWSFSNTVSASTNPCSPPPKPIGLAANPQTSHSIVLTWTQLEDAETYTLQRSLNGATGWTNILVVPFSQEITRYIDDALDAKITYHYRIYATNPGGDSPFSEAVSSKAYLQDWFFPLILP